MTDERPTPETDELSQSIITHNNTYACYEQMKMHARCLERERDDALRKLESLEESITSLDHPNIRILLRQAESYALDVAEKHEKRYCEIKKQLADSNVHLENITIERDSERALADSLAEELKELLYCDLDVNLGRLKSSRDALTAWKEARGE